MSIDSESTVDDVLTAKHGTTAHSLESKLLAQILLALLRIEDELYRQGADARSRHG